ncbi:PREDICTED: diamine acetyltransferase 2-like [Thamnophis sirtalis]|uniref:Diamine acetyltransferase 2-like n=1 Tax=Thamnophis sirtalis TaxID=35019 RepID=A0A6I9WZK0_9SAUR|nr:PREDICTED: diamine acetyltransferase 2-like [Thamnophis sirtalis]
METPRIACAQKGHPIGYVLYYKGYCINHGKLVYLENIYVAPEFRDKGIGKQLLAKLAEVALAAGCTKMKLTTMESNQRAKKLYLGLGAQDTTESTAWHCMEFNEEGLRRLVQGGRAS